VRWRQSSSKILFAQRTPCGQYAHNSRNEPSAGPLITFVQFITVAIFTLPSFVSWSAGPSACFLTPRSIPLKSWIIYTLFFVTVNLLNNWAFAYRISVPLHIILRSGGPVASMVIGYLYNSKRYSLAQVVAILLLTIGVVGAALADAAAQGRSVEIPINLDGDSKALLRSITGFTIIVLAMILSAFQGVYTDRLYAKHGNTHWQEALLYSHLLSLPFFLPTYSHLSSQLRVLLSSPQILSFIETRLTEGLTAQSPSNAPGTTFSTSDNNNNNLVASILNGTTTAILASASHNPALQYLLARTPIMVVHLAANAFTQYLCIRGVYLLAAKSSSLTVTIFLNVRKLMSLILSIYLFGNVLPSGVLIGAFLVFLGGALYGIESARLKKWRQSIVKKS
jgi:solute carrier family 35 (UDP-xylose/UDP-N-acetylglucosamine transporter), member B4